MSLRDTDGIKRRVALLLISLWKTETQTSRDVSIFPFNKSGNTHSTERTTASSSLASSLASRSYGLISAQTERTDKNLKTENTKTRLSPPSPFAAAVTATAYQQIAGPAWDALTVCRSLMFWISEGNRPPRLPLLQHTACYLAEGVKVQFRELSCMLTFGTAAFC